MSKSSEEEVLTIEQVAYRLNRVATRTVSTWVKDKGCPSHLDGRARTFIWSEVLDWYVGYRASLERYDAPTQGDDPSDDPIRRKDVAVAELKELDLQQRRAQLVPMADVTRTLQDVAKGLQVEILGLPTRIVGPALACRERNELFTFLTSECEQLCTRLSQLRFEAKPEPEPDPEDEPYDVDDD